MTVSVCQIRSQGLGLPEAIVEDVYLRGHTMILNLVKRQATHYAATTAFFLRHRSLLPNVLPCRALVVSVLYWRMYMPLSIFMFSECLCVSGWGSDVCLVIVLCLFVFHRLNFIYDLSTYVFISFLSIRTQKNICMRK